MLQNTKESWIQLGYNSEISISLETHMKFVSNSHGICVIRYRLLQLLILIC